MILVDSRVVRVAAGVVRPEVSCSGLDDPAGMLLAVGLALGGDLALGGNLALGGDLSLGGDLEGPCGGEESTGGRGLCLSFGGVLVHDLCGWWRGPDLRAFFGAGRLLYLLAIDLAASKIHSDEAFFLA